LCLLLVLTIFGLLWFPGNGPLHGIILDALGCQIAVSLFAHPYASLLHALLVVIAGLQDTALTGIASLGKVVGLTV